MRRGWFVEQELLHHSHNAILLLEAELRENRQTENFAAELLSDWQAAWFIPKGLVSRLPVDWDRVINDRVDSLLLKVLLEPVAAMTVWQVIVVIGCFLLASLIRTGLAAGAAGHSHYKLIPSMLHMFCPQSIWELEARQVCQ